MTLLRQIACRFFLFVVGVRRAVIIFILKSAVFFVVWFIAQSASAQNAIPLLEFERLSIEQGLSQSSVLCMAQDKTGFLWFGTQDGLNRFDGYTFKPLRNQPNDSNSLSDAWITALLCDHNGNIWVGTRKGLNKIDAATGRITRFLHRPSDKHSLSANRVFSLFEDKNGRLWIGTEKGLHLYNAQTGAFTAFNADSSKSEAFSDNRIYRIADDADGMIWVATENGLNRFDPIVGRCTGRFFPSHDPLRPRPNSIQSIAFDRFTNERLYVATLQGLFAFNTRTQTFTAVDDNADDKNSIGETLVWAILPEVDGTTWIGADNGLFLLNRRGERIAAYHNEPMNAHTLQSSTVKSLFRDRSATLWVGTLNGGISTTNIYRKKFFAYRSSLPGLQSLNNSQVYTFYEDADGALWIGGTNDGIARFDRNRQLFTTFKSNPDDATTLSSNLVRCIGTDVQGSMWFGTRNGGVNRFDRKTGKFKRFVHKPDDSTSLANDQVWCIFRDRSGTMWFGTGNGLSRFNSTTERFESFLMQQGDMLFFNSDNAFASVLENPDGTLWLSSYSNGVWLFDPTTKGVLAKYAYDPQVPTSLASDRVLSLLKDSKGRLWAATANGLSLFNDTTKTFTNYYESDGLPNGFIYGILEDAHGKLWMSTNRGLSRFDPETKDFRNYDANDGLQSNEFNRGAFLRLRSGELAFGGISGFNIFHPDAVLDNPTVPTVVLTSFKVFEKWKSFDRPLHDVREIWLRHNENYIAFEFAALEFTNPIKNRYAYRLDGVDEDWVESGTRRYASYTNLVPGEYTLRIKAANSDGVWNDNGLTVRIIVTPPFWRTNTFIALVVLLIGAGSYGTYRWRVRNIRDQNKLLEHLVTERTAELEEERAKTDQLLVNILPPLIAKRLMQGEARIVDRFEHVSVLFADIAGFTRISSQMSPEQLVDLLDAIFSDFDAVANKYNLEKIKTIGDCYMLVGGLPEPCDEHAERIANAALEMLRIIDNVQLIIDKEHFPHLEHDNDELSIRIGFHIGAVIAGVIGKNKFSYDLWGDTVNVASRMEAQGEEGKIHCTAEVYERLRDGYTFESRGAVDIKGKGLMETYFLTGKRHRKSLLSGTTIPNTTNIPNSTTTIPHGS